METPGIEPGASRMRNERSTTELHPPILIATDNKKIYTLKIKSVKVIFSSFETSKRPTFTISLLVYNRNRSYFN